MPAEVAAGPFKAEFMEKCLTSHYQLISDPRSVSEARFDPLLQFVLGQRADLESEADYGARATSMKPF